MHPAAQLLATLATTPNLPGAACVGERETFDACTDRRAAGRAGVRVYEHAVRVCASCPALAACRAWVTGLPRGEVPFGVTAGVIRRGR